MKKLFCIFLACIAALLTLCGCGQSENVKTVHVQIEDAAHMTVNNNYRIIRSGQDVSFDISVGEDYLLSSCDYPDYGIEQTGEGRYRLTLENVCYPSTVRVFLSYAAKTEEKEFLRYGTITYYPNGGKICGGEDVEEDVYYKHLRANTILGTQFERDGWTLIGWNTQPDGSGTHIGLGSRADKNSVLYAEYMQNTPAEQFVVSQTDGGVKVEKYLGSGGDVVIPQSIDGLKVRAIADGAFKEIAFSSLVLPSSVVTVEEYAFTDCTIEKLYITDNTTLASDKCFHRCKLEKMYINAASRPRYSGTYYDSYADKYDRLLSLRDKKKIVLYSGSSTRFGYDSQMIDVAFGEYDVVNMGVRAYTSSLAQLEFMKPFLREDDVLLVSPEFDALYYQFCVHNMLDYETFALCESNYDIISTLDMRNYSEIFDAFGDYTSTRINLPERDYSLSCRDFDENFVPSKEVYNDYGDYILYRENNYEGKSFSYNGCFYNKKYFPLNFIESFNSAFRPFIKSGVHAYFTYSPRSSISISDDSNATTIEQLDIYLRENIEMPIISGITESIMPPLYFYGTDNHLSTEGAMLRTENVINCLNVRMRADGLI